MAVAVDIKGVVTNGSSFTAGSQQADTTKSMIIVYGTLTLSANYGTGTSHGDPLSFAISSEFAFGNQAPTFVDIKELVAAGAAPAGYVYNYNPGPTLSAPTQAGGVLQILGTGTSSGAGLNEITEGSAYSGFSPSLNGVVLWFEAKFSRL